jgi:hypothetical protein
MPDFGDHDPNNEGGRYFYEGQVNPNDPSLANGGITPEQWEAYQAKRRRDRIFGILGLAGGTVGLGALGAALGGAGAAAGAAGAGAGGGGALAPIAGGAPWAVTPYAGSATMVGTGLGAGAAGAAGAGMAGGGSAIGRLLGGLSARDLAALGLTAAGTVGGMMQDKPNFGPNTQTSDPQLAALMQSMQRRLDKSEPLYDSVLNMANGLLPTQYQKGGGGMG